MTGNIAHLPGWRTSPSICHWWRGKKKKSAYICAAPSIYVLSSPVQIISKIISCNHLILVLAHHSDASHPTTTTTTPANDTNHLFLLLFLPRPSCISAQDREQTLKLPGQNPICASAVCIPSLLVPTLQWSRRSGRTGSCRSHNGHHPDSSHSHARRWTARCTPGSAVAAPLKGETFFFFYCRWQNTYFALPPSSGWSKGVLKSHRGGGGGSAV